MRRLLVALLLGVTALTAGCATSSGSPGDGDATGVKVIDVTFNGNSVTPNGERVPVAVGEQVELDVHADASGEIHVHSDPEQHVDYKAGTTQVPIGSFEIPGQITIESHALDKTIVILQVS
jgi:predicted small secreted protein